MMDRLARRLRTARIGAPTPGIAGTADDTLEAFDVTVHFEGLAAVDGVSISMRNGEVFGLIGPNGAGKTTLVNVLTGFQRPTRGRVELGGDDVTGLPPHELGRRGLARTFQAVRLFRDMPVIENLEAAAVGMGLGAPRSRPPCHPYPRLDEVRAQGRRLGRTRCPTATSGGSASAARLPWRPASSCWTSRRRA